MLLSPYFIGIQERKIKCRFDYIHLQIHPFIHPFQGLIDQLFQLLVVETGAPAQSTDMRKDQRIPNCNVGLGWNRYIICLGFVHSRPRIFSPPSIAHLYWISDEYHDTVTYPLLIHNKKWRHIKNLLDQLFLCFHCLMP